MPAPPIVARSGNNELVLLPRLANRHGLIGAATGSGKTAALQTPAQGFCAIGVPVSIFCGSRRR